jgi:outer membrane protein assembly factor BamA
MAMQGSLKLTQRHVQFPAWSFTFFLLTSMLAVSGNASDTESVPDESVGCTEDYEPAPAGHPFLASAKRWSQATVEQPVPPIEGTVGKIYINRLPIFDEQNPKENNRLYRWANDFHVDTKEKIITRQLLFKSGDTIDQGILAESERILRNNSYVSEAEIKVISRCGEAIDLEVITKEVWTLTPQFSFGSSGGNSKSGFAISDSNLLGTGQRVTVGYSKDTNRNSYELHFMEPNFKGRRVIIRGRLIDSSDGSEQYLNISRPFFALDTRNSWGAFHHSIDRVDKQYDRDKTISRLRHEIDMDEVSYGFSNGLQHGTASRYSIGYRNEQHTFSPEPDSASPENFPADIDLSYPFIQYERVEDKYAKAFDLNQIYRTEDMHLGYQIVSRLGYATSADDTLVYSGSYADTFLSREKMLLQFNSNITGRWNSDTSNTEDLVGQMELKFYRRQTEDRTLFIRLEGTFSDNLNASEQIKIGGEEGGLRGYPANYRTGKHEMYLAVEERIFTKLHLLQLARVGYAVFAEAGRVWDSPFEISGGTVLVDVGVGLRLSLSKTSDLRTAHIDIAFPIDGPDDVDSYQFTVELKQSL